MVLTSSSLARARPRIGGKGWRGDASSMIVPCFAVAPIAASTDEMVADVSKEARTPSPPVDGAQLLRDRALGRVDHLGPEAVRDVSAGLGRLDHPGLDAPEAKGEIDPDPDRPTPEHGGGASAAQAAAGDGVPGDRQWLGQRGAQLAHPLGDRMDHLLRHHRELGQTAAAGGQAVEGENVAEVAVAGPAPPAGPAGPQRLHCDERARRHAGDARSDLDDRATDLMAEHDRCGDAGQRVRLGRNRALGVEDLVKVGPAQPVVGDPKLHLTGWTIGSSMSCTRRSPTP